MKKNKDQRKLYILICFACILVLTGITYIRVNFLTNFNINESINKIDFPEEFTNLTMPFEIEATGYDTFETEDKDFKITFPNNWDLKNGKALLTAMSGGINKPGIETIFLVYKLAGMSGNISFLLVEETGKTDLQDILNTMNIKLEIEEEKSKEDEDKVEVKDLIKEEVSFVNATIVEKTEDSLLLEVTSKEKEGIPVHSYTKIITLNNKSYITSLITLEHCWESEKDSFLEILNTIEARKF